MVLSEDPPSLMCGCGFSVHGSAAVRPCFLRLLVAKLIGARGGSGPQSEINRS